MFGNLHKKVNYLADKLSDLEKEHTKYDAELSRHLEALENRTENIEEKVNEYIQQVRQLSEQMRKPEERKKACEISQGEHLTMQYVHVDNICTDDWIPYMPYVYRVVNNNRNRQTITVIDEYGMLMDWDRSNVPPYRLVTNT